MHIIDIVLCIAGLIFFALGLWRGIIAEIFRLAALGAGFACAAFFHRALAEKLSFFAGSGAIKATVAYIAIFIAVMVVILGAGWLVRKAVQFATLGWIDRLGGGLLGIAKVLLLAWFFFLLMSLIPSDRARESMTHSKTYRIFKSCRIPLKFTPQSLKKGVDPKLIKSLRETGEKLDDFGKKIDSVKKQIE
jgi:membrane protein required for colicin V production